jgi:hypothetical protein
MDRLIRAHLTLPIPSTPLGAIPPCQCKEA